MHLIPPLLLVKEKGPRTFWFFSPNSNFMKNSFLAFFVGFASLLFLSNCKTPSGTFATETKAENWVLFSDSIVKRYGLTSGIFAQLQFKLPDSVILEEVVLSKKSVGVKAGALLVQDDTTYNRIILPAGTPGVFYSTTGAPARGFFVAFSETIGENLAFGPGSSSDGKFVLKAQKDNLIPFGQKKYKPLSGGSGILINLESLRGNSTERVIGGKKLPSDKKN